jgi:hypothetical protein
MFSGVSSIASCLGFGYLVFASEIFSLGAVKGKFGRTKHDFHRAIVTAAASCQFSFCVSAPNAIVESRFRSLPAQHFITQ